MLSSFEWLIAARYLKARRGDRFLSLIASFSLVGIAIGVMVLIVVMAVMNGFRQELFNRVLGLNGHVVVSAYDRGIKDYQEVIANITKVSGVVRITPAVDGQVMAMAGDRATGAFVRGISSEELRVHPHVAPNVVAGSLSDVKGLETVAIGVHLAQDLGLGIGDIITLISPRGTFTPLGGVPRMVGYQVAAIFEVGVYDYDNAFVFMPMEAAQVYFKIPDAVNSLEIFVQNPDAVEPITRQIASYVHSAGYVTDWRQMNQSLFTALVVERNVMFIILTLIIFVAAFNIISSLIILVKDKARDIAILRTMGASRASLLRVFVLVGASIGILGTVIGLVLGVLIAENIQTLQNLIQSFTSVDLWSPEIRFLTEMPAQVRFSEVAITILVSFALSFLATLAPAWRAANLNPVDILRYEG